MALKQKVEDELLSQTKFQENSFKAAQKFYEEQRKVNLKTQNDFIKNQVAIRDHTASLTNLKNKTESLHMENGRLAARVNMCALTGQLEKLRKRVDVFAEIETVGLLEHTYLPKLRNCAEFIDQNMAKMEQLLEIVAKFDQNLCNKVNKSQLIIFENEMRDNYMDKKCWEEIDKKIYEVRS